MRYFNATAAVLAMSAVAAMLSSAPAKAELGGEKHVGAQCTYQNPMAPSGVYYLDRCPVPAKVTVTHHHAHHG
jgi:uncharacterized membrane protein